MNEPHLLITTLIFSKNSVSEVAAQQSENLLSLLRLRSIFCLCRILLSRLFKNCRLIVVLMLITNTKIKMQSKIIHVIQRP